MSTCRREACKSNGRSISHIEKSLLTQYYLPNDEFSEIQKENLLADLDIIYEADHNKIADTSRKFGPKLIAKIYNFYKK